MWLLIYANMTFRKTKLRQETCSLPQCLKEDLAVIFSEVTRLGHSLLRTKRCLLHHNRQSLGRRA